MAPAPFTVIRGGRLLDGDAADILIEGDAIKELLVGLM